MRGVEGGGVEEVDEGRIQTVKFPFITSSIINYKG